MAQQTIDNGDSGLQARNKINSNFTELFSIAFNPDGSIPMTGDLDMGGNFIRNLAQGQGTGEAVTWDQWIAGIDGVKNLINVRAAASGNLVLSGEQTVDGVACVEDDYVFAKDQTDATEKLVYVVKPGAWEVAPENDSAVEVQTALVVVGSEGTENKNTRWIEVVGNVVIGTTELIWVPFESNVPIATPETAGRTKLYTETGANTDGTMDQNSITDALELKLDAADYNDRFKGRYTSLVALQTAHPTAEAGDYAQVNEVGAGEDQKVVNYNWDDEDEEWVIGGSGSAATTTDELPEGATNLYFTNARALTAAPAETDITIGALINGLASKAAPIDADYLGLMDSAASNVLKKLSWSNVKATLKTYFDTLYKAIGIQVDDTIQLMIDGGGSALVAGSKGVIVVPFNCTIQEAMLLADVSGSVVIDIWKDSYANYPPTVADTITASAKPTISSATKSQDSTLTGWTTSLTKGDILKFNVDSAATITNVTVILKVLKG